MVDGKQVKNKANPTGVGKYLDERGVYVALTSLGSGHIIVTSGVLFTTPSNITTSTVFYIELIGGGGAAAGSGAVTNGRGSAGQAGSYLYVKITGLSPNTSYPCTIGVGGGVSVANTLGASGGDTTLTIGATTYTAQGGRGGAVGSNVDGGSGGIAINGDINLPGSPGEDSITAASTSLSARGGNSHKGWGYGGKSVRSGKHGENGTGYGGGGGGPNISNGFGGAGTQGIIFCQWFNV